MSRNRRRAAPSVAPEKPQGLWTARTLYYRDQLAIICKGLFDVELPIEWDYDYVLDNLIYRGVFAVTDTSAGILPFRTAFSGTNYMNQPVNCVIDVPHFKEMRRVIGEECEIFFLMRKTSAYGFYNYQQTFDIFAERLASADACVDVNLMNSRIAYLIEAETKAQAETIKKAYSDVTMGEPYVVIRKGSVDSKLASQGVTAFFNNVSGNFIAGDVQDVKRTIINELLTQWGINNANTDKKERLITGEVDSNNQELACNINTFRAVMERQNKRVKKLYPELEFNIEFAFDPEKVREQAYATMVTNKPMGVSPSGGR